MDIPAALDKGGLCAVGGYSQKPTGGNGSPYGCVPPLALLPARFESRALPAPFLAHDLCAPSPVPNPLIHLQWQRCRVRGECGWGASVEARGCGRLGGAARQCWVQAG